MRMLTLATALVLGIAAPSLGAQDHDARRHHDRDRDEARREDVAVEVRNDRHVPVTIFLRGELFDRRLGEVGARATATLPLPRDTRDGERIRLVAHAAGDVDDLGTSAVVVSGPGVLSLLIPAHGWRTPTPDDTMSVALPADEVADATITVENPRRQPVTVYAEDGLFDVRLGRVGARATATLRFPKSVVRTADEIRVFVTPDGGADLASEPLHIRRGDHLALRVPRF